MKELKLKDLYEKASGDILLDSGQGIRLVSDVGEETFNSQLLIQKIDSKGDWITLYGWDLDADESFEEDYMWKLYNEELEKM